MKVSLMTATGRVLWLVAMICLAAGADAKSAESGTLRGRFLLHGDLPDDRPPPVGRNMNLGRQGGIPNEQLVVAADRGLANILIFIRNKDIPPPPKHMPGPTLIEISGGRYKPHFSVLQSGQELVIRNTDPVLYQAQVATIHNYPMDVIIPVGRSQSRRFEQSERIPARVMSNTHPAMEAWVFIHSNPYACVSKENGAFEMKNVPYGTWEVQLWHETFGYLKEVSVAGVVESTPRGRMAVVVNRDETDVGDIVLDYQRLTRK